MTSQTSSSGNSTGAASHCNFKKVISVILVHLMVTVILLSRECIAAKEKCSTCKDIVSNFKEGLEKTKKSNFGGGNTRWEEKSLGSWAHSETRLVEIWENHLCKDAKECHFMLEKYEEDMEEFWFKVHAKNEDVDMIDWLCINRIKVCCPSNTYGPKCLPCPGEKERACKGNGKCQGEGTREGNGKCNCDSGYHGDLCDTCTDGYFEANKNDTHTTCTACHQSCKTTCWEAGPKGCDECKNGWLMADDTCVDVDECKDTPCDENQYCANNEGSYLCATCHKACHGCSAYGANKCDECKQGYKQQDTSNNMCVDIDECGEDTTLCTGDKQSCVNKDGSYECKCEDGFIYDASNQLCFPKPKEGEEEEKVTPEDKTKEEL